MYDEVTVNRTTKTQIDNTLNFFTNRISNVKFDPKGESRLEYARLRSSLLLGKGESACMVYCRDNQDVLGSSNLKDIKKYSANTKDEVGAFIADVIAKGSKLPHVDIEKYIPTSSI